MRSPEQVTAQLPENMDKPYADRFAAFRLQVMERLPDEAYVTIRHALEDYTQDLEENLLNLINDSANHINDRPEGYHEEVALAAELVSYANMALYILKEARTDHEVNA